MSALNGGCLKAALSTVRNFDAGGIVDAPISIF